MGAENGEIKNKQKTHKKTQQHPKQSTHYELTQNNP